MRSLVAATMTACLAATVATADPFRLASQETETGDRREEPVLDGEVNDPTGAVEELLDESKRDDDGLIQAGSGGADPKENWMGCDLAGGINETGCQDPPPPEN